jgi:hypothetical protein
MNPNTNKRGVLITGLPDTSVASHAKICTPLGIAIMKLASEMKLREIWGMPVENM